MYIIKLSLSILTAIFPGEPRLAGFIEAKDDGSGGDTGAISRYHHHLRRANKIQEWRHSGTSLPELSWKMAVKPGMLTRPGVSRPRASRPRPEVSRPRPRPEIKAKVEFNSYGL